MSSEFYVNINESYLNLLKLVEKYTKQDTDAQKAKMKTLEYKIRYDRAYRANPDNIHHSAYQNAVDRRLAVTLFVFILTVMPLVYGWQLFAFTLGVAVASLIFVTICVMIPLCKIAIKWFIDWLNGY